MHLSLRVKFVILVGYLNCIRQIFEKYLNIKFHENPSSGSRLVPCGRTNGLPDKLRVAFRNFAEAPFKMS
jgi:hypothetical protein